MTGDDAQVIRDDVGVIVDGAGVTDNGENMMSFDIMVIHDGEEMMGLTARGDSEVTQVGDSE